MNRKGTPNPNLHKHGVKFGSGQPTDRGGRPKKIYTVLKEKGFGKDDIKLAFGEIAFYTIEELENVYKNDDLPVIARIIANQFYTALKDSDWSKIKDILEHVIGRPATNDNDDPNEKETKMDFINFRLGHKPLDEDS